MHLISLELNGFKSFPDKVKLEFGKGITGVVGPNGSGKSNIGDAMRWVMGEQSSKTLRGGKMDDVIFSGTESRKGNGFALATLNIDNTDRSLAVESDIVSVTRKLYKNGDSEYSINSNSVRLKDVVELFMDTGLGRDGYSIIGQGRISEIVSSKSTDRREIFEEAAGISKFRYKKLQAERKLIAAQDNIVRLNDIIAELEGRVGPLKSQSEKAKKFRVLDDEKRKLEISVWVNKLSQLKQSMTELEEKLESMNKQYIDVSEETQALEISIEDNFADGAKCTEEIERLREEIHKIELDNSQAESKIAVFENDILHINEAISTLNAQIEQSASSAEELQSQKKEKEQKKIEISADVEALDNELAAAEGEFEKLTLRSDEFDKALGDDTNKINSLYISVSELNFRIENDKNTISEIEQSITLVTDNKLETEKAYDECATEKKELYITLENIGRQIGEHSNRLAGYTKLLERKNEQLSKARKEFSECEGKIREKRQKLNLLNDLENSMEGFTRSVKQVIKASKQGQIKGICGSVAQLVSTKPEYSVAVETALGGALQNIIVENEDTAKRCIRYLKDENAGRATFLPITSVSGKSLNEKGIEGCDGYIAIANEIVEYDSKYSGVISSLLGRTVVAEDIDMATVIAKKFGYRFKIVTLDGQVINAGGSFTGGSVSKSTGILSRKNEIDELTAEVAKLSESFKELDASTRQLSQETQKLVAETEAEKETISEMNTDKVRFESEIKRVSEISAQLDSRLEEVDIQLEQMKTKINSAEKDFETATVELSATKDKISELEAGMSESQQQHNELKLAREKLSQKLSDKRMKRVELVKDIQVCEQTIEQLSQMIEATNLDRNEFDAQIFAHNESISAKKTEIEQINNSLGGSDGKIGELNTEISVQQAKHNDFERLANEQRGLLKIKNEEKENLAGAVSRMSEKQTAVSVEFDKIITELWEQYELSRSEASEIAEPIEDMQQANKRLSELRSKIKNLGNVNLGAIEEYIEVSQRYEFMSKELGDVLTSKTELEKLIVDLTENMKQIFTDSFEKINSNFERIFAELFGGGKAELVLADKDDVLECGIDINVAPPGKVIKNLSLLSGGEQAFVAIAIYFAILAVKPSPFCLLDEIEAALDDVNVTKYAQYLRKFTEKTQFIAITHRRGTMEEADVLYGVTMQEKGVSKLLKMSVSETAKL